MWSIKNEKKDSPKKNVAKSSSALLEEELQKKKIKDMNLKQNVGYSFGLKTSLDANLKAKRREKY